jgi:hypothetical protein
MTKVTDERGLDPPDLNRQPQMTTIARGSTTALGGLLRQRAERCLGRANEPPEPP